VGTLLESELFGHEKGAFTGAISTKKGKFELAGKGTIFLDEVSELSLDLQAKLLRFLQDKEFQRVGGIHTLRSEARVIAATNRPLRRLVEEGRFREDLYYRLSVATIKVPPLRERASDIPLLAEYLLRKINRQLGTRIRGIHERALQRMMEYPWPGNVRELENVLTKAALVASGDVILEEDISPLLESPEDQPRTMSLQEVERAHILKVLHYTNWHYGKACEILGISRPTLRQKMRRYGIEPPPRR
ncbi:MAG: sigma-54-dependent Fis family transcriptional regulator, partial [Deltaproteobacteria bacterium]